MLGNPVAHSQSPFIHTEFARQTGQAMSYGRELCALDGFEAALQHFADSGGRGCNVTVPFKFEACRLASWRSAAAELAGAANVLARVDGGWHASNTDGAGLVQDIEHNAGVVLQGLRVLLVGAGGAGAGVLGPLLQARPSALVLANRSQDKAVALAERHQPLARQHGVALTVAPLAEPGLAFDVLMNASASSLQGLPSPVPASALRPGTLAIDLMYGAAAEPFLRWAQAHGAVARDGLGMLVEQAAGAFEVWRGLRPATVPVLAALRQRLAAAA